MIKLLIAVSLAMLAGCAHAKNGSNNYEEMYRNSFVSRCDGMQCTDLDTGEVLPLEDGEKPRYGDVINFSRYYTVEEIKAAMPYILKKYREGQHE
jgi:hypothetical protein